MTHLPHSPAFVEGVINLRGKVISLINLRRRFRLPDAEHTRATRIVVVDINDQVIGMVRRTNPALPIRAEIAELAEAAAAGQSAPVVQLVPHEGGLKLSLLVRPFGNPAEFLDSHCRGYV